MDNMDGTLYLDYRNWVIFLLKRISFLIEFEEKIGQILPVILEKRDFFDFLFYNIVIQAGFW